MKISIAKIQKGLVAVAAALGLIANTALASGTTGKYITDAIGIVAAIGVILVKNEPNLVAAATLINKVTGRQVVTVDTTGAAPVVATAASPGIIVAPGDAAPAVPVAPPAPTP
jgi:hypothetical protein